MCGMSLRGKRDIDAEAAWIDRLLKRPDVSDETHFLINAWYEDAHVLAWVNQKKGE